MLGARVPEATMYQDGNAGIIEDNIGAPAGAAYWRNVRLKRAAHREQYADREELERRILKQTGVGEQLLFERIRFARPSDQFLW